MPASCTSDARARIDNYGIYSIDGDVAVDFIGRYETLGGDLKLALERVGLCLATELPYAKATFRQNDLPYRDYYDDETRDIVANWYAREIELARLSVLSVRFRRHDHLARA